MKQINLRKLRYSALSDRDLIITVIKMLKDLQDKMEKLQETIGNYINIKFQNLKNNVTEVKKSVDRFDSPSLRENQ